MTELEKTSADATEIVSKIKYLTTSASFELTPTALHVMKGASDAIETLVGMLEDIAEDEDYWHEVAVKRNGELKAEEFRNKVACKIINELREKLNKSRNKYEDLIHRYNALANAYMSIQDKLRRQANNPQNFCGNCKYFEMSANDVGVCVRLKDQNKYLVVDPDDASCSRFKSNQTDRVVIGKPEFPCCDKCNREDCDNCTLCPF